MNRKVNIGNQEQFDKMIKYLLPCMVVFIAAVTLASSCKKDVPVIPQLLFISSIKTHEGNSSIKEVTVEVTLSQANEQEVSLKWSTIEGTAKAGLDFLPVSDSLLVFAPGETTKIIHINLINDLVFEFDDSFTIDIHEVKNAQIGFNQIKATILNDDTYTVSVDADGPVTPDHYDGMQLVFNDEFLGNSVNTGSWKFELGGGGWGNNELQIYTDSPLNAFVSDGKLNIVATKSLSGIYNSARLITAGRNEVTYGRIDIRAKLPVGKGIWPALWMLGSNIGQVNWPACGEIDIMEYLGHESSKSYGTAHYKDAQGHKYKGGSFTLPGSERFSEKFHVFSIMWQENSITWYVDYQEYYKLTSSDIIFDAFRLPQFFIFNVAVGGAWPGNPDASTVFPQTMQVDYVRVFQPE